MSHPIEVVVGLVVAAVIAVAMIVLPRHKPEPPQQEQRPPVESVAAPAPPVVEAEPSVEKTDAERIDKLEYAVGEIAAEQKNLSAIAKQLTEREKAK